jgi:hypothetical protein
LGLMRAMYVPLYGTLIVLGTQKWCTTELFT